MDHHGYIKLCPNIYVQKGIFLNIRRSLYCMLNMKYHLSHAILYVIEKNMFHMSYDALRTTNQIIIYILNIKINMYISSMFPQSITLYLQKIWKNMSTRTRIHHMCVSEIGLACLSLAKYVNWVAFSWANSKLNWPGETSLPFRFQAKNKIHVKCFKMECLGTNLCASNFRVIHGQH